MKLFRKLFIAVCIICLSYSNIGGMLNVYACEDDIYTLTNYLEDESRVDKTALSSELESELNLKGIFDDEIDAMSERTLNLL